MSDVTNVMLHCSVFDRHLVDEVNLFFEGSSGSGLVDILAPGHWYGGTKGFEASVFVAACNYLNLDALCDHIRKLSWREPGCLQLIVKEQEDFAFRVIQIFAEAFKVAQDQQVSDFSGPWPPPALSALRLGGLPSPGMVSAQPNTQADAQVRPTEL